ncbi:MAG: hypothetical protein PHT75_01830 [Bacilli bacterium]|nr:hypothetical protein [Bacilli bacterium]MDD3304853.1 hypothetical protein [Bacilli bacterium]MDD4053698.1 hypothetical protein [Bacilli bacterium]MDD4411569.1 hypothetical protein [Bacilli bacterium]
MNQKGIVLSGLVYVLLIFFLLLILSLLTVMWYRQNTLNTLSNNANEIYDENEKIINGPYYNASEGVNHPYLAKGMTPVKWDGSKWIMTTTDDPDWYDYKESSKKWANAITEDDSMWVWIPRYSYNISAEWHSNVTGTINIQFSMVTDDTRGGTVTIVDTGSSNDSNGTWTNHPAFTFGDAELTGIWVAKFEASGTKDSISIKPNKSSLRNLTIGEMFTSARGMENNDLYGWGSDGKFIDTHMAKNVEWGAATYLSKSIYGKNIDRIWINPADNYTTGCAGEVESSLSTTGCLYQYYTPKGVQTSTTGNVYGIYDMSGGTYEYTAAYVDNFNINLITYGNSIINAADKYKDIYTKASTETQENNYITALNKKGDAIYETSNSYTGTASWFADFSQMAYDKYPWFNRGSDWDTFSTSPFSFICSEGLGGVNTFRPILLVNNSL